MSILFSPIQIRGIQLKNRIVLSPMCQYSATDGFANDWHLVHLGSRAVGGAGLIISEAVAVSPEGRISAKDLGIWKDEHIPELKRITDFIKGQGAIAGIQLAHAGRKASLTPPWEGDTYHEVASGGWKTIAPSAVPFSDTYGKPSEMTLEDIRTVVYSFQRAAARAAVAGFQVVEIHGAHGYLVHEFLSPLSNFRTDAYGGIFENRIRLLLEIIDAIRLVWPEELPLFLRISASDWADSGWTPADSVRLAAMVQQKGIDLIDCSSGGVVPGIKIPAKPGYQVPFAANVRSAGILTGAVGIIVSGTQAEQILSNNEADLIFVGREMLRNPYFPQSAAAELNEDVAVPLQYDRAKRRK
jgi:2,4-dienoyl-CoA reductase-like NADH-dependent reductase (Old Yellow Enzyme family)